jgi:hypothetical protein
MIGISAVAERLRPKSLSKLRASARRRPQSPRIGALLQPNCKAREGSCDRWAVEHALVIRTIAACD